MRRTSGWERDFGARFMRRPQELRKVGAPERATHAHNSSNPASEQNLKPNLGRLLESVTSTYLTWGFYFYGNFYYKLRRIRVSNLKLLTLKALVNRMRGLGDLGNVDGNAGTEARQRAGA